MTAGLDYSYSHPDLVCAKSRGYSFVARYIGDPDPNSAKYLDAPELAAIRAAGLSVVVVRETTAGFMLTESGAAHARASRAHCTALGLYGVPIYYALDVDPRGLTAAQRGAVTQFLQDAAAADGGGHNVGLYGSDDAIDLWVGTSYCRWGWQTYAWSGGRVSPKAHFRQYLNGQSVCGGTVDLNETYAADFGQWPRPTPNPPAPPPEDDDMSTYILGHPDGIGWLISPFGAVVLDADTQARYLAAGWKSVALADAATADAIIAAANAANTQGAQILAAVEGIDGTPGNGPFPPQLLASFSGSATITPAPE